ncbi:hypothetical protein NXW84_10645 [Bacteroides fragilis]|nr:hypothetical protein NXW84_10645 [Bacteroides fragilis]
MVEVDIVATNNIFTKLETETLKQNKKIIQDIAKHSSKISYDILAFISIKKAYHNTINPYQEKKKTEWYKINFFFYN